MLAVLGSARSLTDEAYAFTFDPAGRQRMHRDSVTHRFSRLARRLGLRTADVCRVKAKRGPLSLGDFAARPSAR